MKLLEKARHFVTPLLEDQRLDSGEPLLSHLQQVTDILQIIGVSEDVQVAAYLGYTCTLFTDPEATLNKTFPPSITTLAIRSHQLTSLQKPTPTKNNKTKTHRLQEEQTEKIRKMLLAFASDIRVVVIYLASCLQTLRYYTVHKEKPLVTTLANETLQVSAPLANRLGLGQLKWEMEDLAFRFLEPKTYRSIAQALAIKRTVRETLIKDLISHIGIQLKQQGIQAQVEGRPKHIYSIVKKMRGKHLSFDQVMDISAIRIIVPELDQCYTALAWIHQQFNPINQEFKDYIAQPKPNGYQSLHTVVTGKHNETGGKPLEIQVRTSDMHKNAEHGVAAHWVYKESGTKGYTGVQAKNPYEEKIALLRQLLAWQQDLSHHISTQLLHDHIYVFTPEARVIELTQGSTPIDFAYALHTDLGHRCRGAKVDQQIVTLNTPLQNGQTLEIITTKTGGPSRDWLNPELGFVKSKRARSKIRAWFNLRQLEDTKAKGREIVEKILQRKGKTTTNLESLATELACKSADHLFELVGKEAFPTRYIEQALQTDVAIEEKPEKIPYYRNRDKGQAGLHGILVEGTGGLMHQLARCCKPLPPEAIGGFVTRGKGINVHRQNCSNYQYLLQHEPERCLPISWVATESAYYRSTIELLTEDLPYILRDISEIFIKEKVSITNIKTQKNRPQQLTIRIGAEVANKDSLQRLIATLNNHPEIIWVRRV